MDDFDNDDFDRMVDNHLDENDYEHREQENASNNNEPDVKDEKRIVPVKIRVKRPQPKLNAER